MGRSRSDSEHYARQLFAPGSTIQLIGQLQAYLAADFRTELPILFNAGVEVSFNSADFARDVE